MKYDEDNILWIVEELSVDVEVILPPLEILDECGSLARGRDEIREIIIGYTEAGVALNAYEFGHGRSNVLLYGFPDPGEAVGGTTILSLLRALAKGNEYLLSLDVSWYFIPCLNPDDQPDGGRSLSAVFRNPEIRDIDWCVSNPRSETRALLEYARKISPALILPLHDEYHSATPLPLYMLVSECIELGEANLIRESLKTLGFSIKGNCAHDIMGAGFEVAAELAGDEYPESTFSLLQNYGLLAICEVSQQDGITPTDLVAAQLAFMLIMLDGVLKRQSLGA